MPIYDRGDDPCPASCPEDGCGGSCAMTRGHPKLLDHACNKNKTHRW